MSDTKRDEQRATVLTGAKALGNGAVEVRGDIVAAVIAPNAPAELRKRAGEAGNRAIAINAAELVDAIEGKAKPAADPTPVIEKKPFGDKTRDNGGNK